MKNKTYKNLHGSSNLAMLMGKYRKILLINVGITTKNFSIIIFWYAFKVWMHCLFINKIEGIRIINHDTNYIINYVNNSSPLIFY